MHYKCNNCEKYFNKKSNYIFHINRKFPCKKTQSSIINDSIEESLNIMNNGSNPPHCVVNVAEMDINIIPLSHKTLCLQDDDSLDLLCHGDNNEQQSNQCHKCLKILSSHKSLKRHISIGCKGNKEMLQCDDCLTVFTRLDALKRHTKGYCKGYKTDPTEESDKLIIAKLLSEMQIMKNKLELIESHPTLPMTDSNNITNNIKTSTNSDNTINNIIHNNINNVNSNNSNVILNVDLVAFGEEQIGDILSDDQCKTLFNRGFSAVPILIKHVHCNKNIPQYNNCYISNMRDKNGLVYDGDKWILMKLCDLVDALCDKKHVYLENKYDEYKQDKGESIVQFDRYLKEQKKDSKALAKRYKEDVPLILYNNRDVAIQTKNNIKKSTKQ